MAKITVSFRNGLFSVVWVNAGSDLRARPRYFRTAAEVQAFCNTYFPGAIIREV
jgi:hypothetical protein